MFRSADKKNTGVLSRQRFEQNYSSFHGNDDYHQRWNSEYDQQNKQKLGERIKRLIKDQPKMVLEIGCAQGESLNQMPHNGLGVGLDIRQNCLQCAKNKFPLLSFIKSDSNPMPFKNDVFDLVFQFVTFSSIKNGSIKKAIAVEAIRVLKPGGLFLWYDFRYPNPLNPFTTYESRRRIRGYFNGNKVHLDTMTMIPQIGRLLYQKNPSAYKALDKIHLLHSHYFGYFIKDA